MADSSQFSGPAEPAESLAGEELRRRAAGGALLLGARGALILGFALGANIVLARLLAPRDFGVVALGTVLIVLGGYLADGGLGAALTRRPEPPTRRELEAVNGVQLAATVALAVTFAAGSIAFGRDGLVLAVMVATLPITVLRAPATILLQRELHYRTIATVDVVDALSFYAWAVSTVALGMGVWGMASGMVVRAVAGTVVMTRMGPLGLVRPKWCWSDVRPLLGFGMKVQAVAAVTVVREQGLNVAVAAIAGVATLGVWNLAWRVLAVPFTLITAVARVGYPAMSRMLAAGENPRPVIERGLATVSVLMAVVLVAIVGFAPALPALVGDAWADVPETLLWSSLALLVAPVYAVLVGYLYAVDDVQTVVRFMLIQTGLWFAVALPLVSTLGAPAIGLGWIPGALISATFLSRRATRRTGAAVATSLAAPAAFATLAGALAWLTASARTDTVLHGLLGAAVGELVLLGGLTLTRPSLLRDTYGLLRRSMRAATAAPPEAAA